MPGPPPKPPGQKIRRNKSATTKLSPHLVVIDGAKFDKPELPAKLAGQKPLKVTSDAWDGYWADPVARAAGVADMPAVLRWATLVDELERVLRAFRADRLVSGSMGQVVTNPLWQVAKGVLGEVRQLEDRLGMSPMSRLRLQIDAGSAATSIEEMNARLDASDDGDNDDDDPRLTLASDG